MSIPVSMAYGVADCGIKRVAVIGAGAMGAGIAAQFSNAGVPVELLDIAGPEDRDAPAREGIQRQLKAGGFMHPDAAQLVTPGNIEDHLDRLKDVDWIIEAVIERLDIKRDLYAKIDKVRKPEAIISSNTSTIPRADLVAEASAAFAKNFVITHFFNPPRVMQLVELVSAPQNDPALVAKVRAACQVILGKTVVDARDTPGFIANRIGCFWIAVSILEAKRLGLTPEESDAVMTVFGVPRTGVFGLADLVGLDLVPNVWGGLMASLPESDAIHAYDLPGDPTIEMLLQSGRLGRKTKAGFFRMNAEKQLETLDFEKGDYRPAQPLDTRTLPGGGRDIAALLEADGKYSDYARRVFTAVVAYVVGNAPEIADDVGAIDAALSLGYGWKQGPCQLADIVGPEKISAWLEADGLAVPALLTTAMEQSGFFNAVGDPLKTDGKYADSFKNAGPVNLAQFKTVGTAIIENDAASLWNMGDGVACLEIHTKLNSLAPEVFDILEQALDRGGKDSESLVIGNDDPRAFSAGADLSAIVGYISGPDLDALDSYIARGQELFRRMRFANFPIVAAMHGLALGGGCEIALHASRRVIHAELKAGLPEVLVGLVPGWGGCTQLLVNAQSSPHGPKGPVAIAQQVFDVIFSGKRSNSALEARANGIMRAGDLIVMGRDALLQTAKDTASEMVASGFEPPEEAALILAGPSGKSAIMSTIHAARAAGRLTDTDVDIADALAGVLTGGPDVDLSRPVAEAHVMQLECATLISLAKVPTTKARIEHMLKTGKPLRN